MQSYMFTKLQPKDVSFVRGETPSPAKLDASFAQIKSAFFLLESFLGNGVDYRTTQKEDRKLLFNVSSAIGRTDKLYKPINKVPDLYRLYKKYSGLYGSYDSVLKTLTLANQIIIPAEIYSGEVLSIYYTGQAKLVTDGPNHLDYIFPQTAVGVYEWRTVVLPDDISYFYFGPNSGKTLSFKVLNVSSVDSENMSFNTGYSLSLDNTTYSTVKVPCFFAGPLVSGSTACVNKTCNYCIGNTYIYDKDNINYGSPTCSGAQSQTHTSLTYQPEVANLRSTYLTIQSPLNITENPYALKYRPFSMHSAELDYEIPYNMLAIYDIKDGVSAIKYNTNIYSAGGINNQVRGDIVYITDNKQIVTGDNKRYLVIGGNYGLVDLLHDTMTFVERQIPTGIQLVGEAVYG